MNIGIFYGSTTGNAQAAAESIGSSFAGETVTCKNIADADPAEITGFDLLVLGSSTWGDGELQDDWHGALPGLEALDLSGKRVALFGVGDQGGWADTFVDAMGILYDCVTSRGAEVVGAWPVEGYEHTESRAVVNGEFVGLALDETNQPGMTEERIKAWVERVRNTVAV